jgi:hypothetical protein
MSKEERSELKGKLKSMDEKGDSSEVNISVVPNFQTERTATLGTICRGASGRFQ